MTKRVGVAFIRFHGLGNLLSMHLRSEVKAEPLWIALGGDLLSTHMAAASCNTKIHLSVMPIATFSSSYGDVNAAPCCGLRNDSARRKNSARSCYVK